MNTSDTPTMNDYYRLDISIKPASTDACDLAADSLAAASARSHVYHRGSGYVARKQGFHHKRGSGVVAGAERHFGIDNYIELSRRHIGVETAVYRHASCGGVGGR